jgi:CRISPR-associated protein Cmr5
MANLKTLTQKYALYAFECINEVKKIKNKKLERDYRSRVKRLPAMITHNGLLTTLAFLYSKATFEDEANKKNNTSKDISKEENTNKGTKQSNSNVNEFSLLLRHLIYWLKNPYATTPEELSKNDIKDFIYQLTKEDFQKLMLHSQRALTLSQWLKRLTEGEFEDEDTKG